MLRDITAKIVFVNTLCRSYPRHSDCSSVSLVTQTVVRSIPNWSLYSKCIGYVLQGPERRFVSCFCFNLDEKRLCFYHIRSTNVVEIINLSCQDRTSIGLHAFVYREASGFPTTGRSRSDINDLRTLNEHGHWNAL